ncbi:MAG: hypothetical protein AAFQ51_16670 [Pseudomonadota bacterium]
MIGDYNPVPLFILAALCAYPMWRLLPAHGIDRNWVVAAFLPAGLVVLLWIIAFRKKEQG